MRQFVLPADWDGSSPVLLGGREARRLVRVLRLGTGDRFPGVDSSGKRYDCEIAAVEGDRVILEIRSAGVSPASASASLPLPDLRGGKAGQSGRGRSKPADPEIGVVSTASAAPGATAGNSPARPRIILAAGLLKGEKFDLVIRQAVEAGVDRVIPLVTRRSLGSAAGEARRERQARIVREALEQSGSRISTVVEESVALPELARRLAESSGAGLRLVLHEAPLAAQTLHGYLGSRPDEVILCVGPEGGFAPDEVELLLASGFHPFRLPGAVLRAETAALFAVAAVEIVVAEHDSWNRAQG